MTLAALIRKGGLSRLATATLATPATSGADKAGTVATVATVAVAKPAALPSRDDFEERAALVEFGAGVPREWAEGFAVLCVMPCPDAYSQRRWEQIRNDGGLFLDQWGRQAAALGWRAVDVFGVNPDAPAWRYDGMGLVPLLEGRRVVAITADTARIECGRGVYQTYYRTALDAGAVAIWKRGEKNER